VALHRNASTRGLLVRTWRGDQTRRPDARFRRRPRPSLGQRRLPSRLPESDARPWTRARALSRVREEGGGGDVLHAGV